MRVYDWPTFSSDKMRRNRKKIKKKGKQDSNKVSNRKADRHAEWGRGMENRISSILTRMVEDGLIHSFEQSVPRSQKDREGKDFTVRKSMEDKIEEKYFGCTISARHLNDSIGKHPYVPQWLTPINIKDETMRKKVLSLF